MNTLLIYGITTVLMIIIWLPTWHLLGGPRITLLLSAAAVAGPMSILASLFNWHWFFNSRRVSSVVNRVGRSWARFIYAFLGMFLLIPGSIALALSGIFYYAHIRSWVVSITGG